MGGLLGAILARFLSSRYDGKLSGKGKAVYKKGILVGKQRYIIVKPLNVIMMLLAVYSLIFHINDFYLIFLNIAIIVAAILILLEKPKVALLFHLLALLWDVVWILQSSGSLPIYPFLNIAYESLPGITGILFILVIFAFMFDVSLMENLRTTLRHGGISKVEREKIKEYLKKEKKFKR